jgi:Glycosyl hydrolase family 99
VITRRTFVRRALAGPAAAALAPFVEPRTPLERAAVALRARFPRLRRHFVFEYYPWYGASPWHHWDQWERTPPNDLAATSVPLLGAYDSRSARVLEQHARWMADAGVGAVNVSWWGPDDYTDRAVPVLMDVMRAHDIHVAFHLEPYEPGRARNFARDVLYLIKEYGERRRWDALLLLDRADGSKGPVFKTFFTILPEKQTDCHGVTREVPFHVPPASWREQIDVIRRELRSSFDHVTLLSDSPDADKTADAGFDGLAIYNNYIRPKSWPGLAAAASRRNVVFSFNINPGFDSIAPRTIEPGSCYQPPAFEPPAGSLDWRADGRRKAHALALERITESFEATLTLQADRRLASARRGFFLAYICTFNEWHEGTAFEPAKSWADLSDEERRLGYHNPDDGGYRLKALKNLVRSVVD